MISHNRYTLVDQTAKPLTDDAAERGVAFVNAAPFGGGMLVKGPDVLPRYRYERADDQLIARVREIKRICDDAGVPLAAAALQFSTRDPRVASTIVGMSNPARIDQTVDLLETPIGADLWEELLPLVRGARLVD